MSEELISFETAILKMSKINIVNDISRNETEEVQFEITSYCNDLKITCWNIFVNDEMNDGGMDTANCSITKMQAEKIIDFLLAFAGDKCYFIYKGFIIRKSIINDKISGYSYRTGYFINPLYDTFEEIKQVIDKNNLM